MRTRDESDAGGWECLIEAVKAAGQRSQGRQGPKDPARDRRALVALQMFLLVAEQELQQGTRSGSTRSR